MSVNLSIFAGAGAQFLDNNANPLSGGLIYSYLAGTTTPEPTYTTLAGNVAHPNPIVLDSAGRVPSGGEIWLNAGTNYKFIVKTATGTTLGTFDNIQGNNDYSQILTSLAASNGSSLIGYTQGAANSTTRTVQSRLRDRVSVFDFMTTAQIADVRAGTALVDVSGAIQAALDSSVVGLELYFPAGTYRVEAPLVPKVVVPSPAFTYNLTVMGDGPGVSVIKAFHSGNVFTITQGQASYGGRDSNLFFNMISISGNYQASHCIYADYIAGMKLVDCIFSNANTAQVRIGVDPSSECYGIDVRNTYMNNNAINSGMATAGLYLFKARYVLVDRLTVDGAAYGIFMDGCDKGFIQNCHLEGPKIAALWIQGSGGGEHKIANNMFFPYVGFDASAKFEGTLYGLYMIGNAGGNAFNNVVGNVFIVNQSGLPIKTTISGGSGALVASPALLITGATSGATGYLDGYVAATGKAVIRVVSGTFQAGENISQATTGGTGTLGVIVNPDSAGIVTTGSSAYHNIVGNQFKTQPKTCIVLQGTGCNVSENQLFSADGGNGIYKDTAHANVVGNTIEAPGGGNAIWNVSGTINSIGNYVIAGALPGMTDYNMLNKGLLVTDSNELYTTGDFVQSLIRNSTNLFKLSNNGTGAVHLAGCNGATVWLGSSSGEDRASRTIGVNGSGQLITSGIPTSSAGLPSGAVYSNGGVLTLVP